MRVFITFIIIGFSTFAAAQPDTTILKNQIKLSVYRIVDPANPGIELNYERSHTTKFSSELTVAYMGNIVGSGNYFEGFRIGFEEKRFVKTRISDTRVYLSNQVVYNNSSLKNVDNYGYDSTSRTYINAPFRIAKRTLAFNVKIGGQFFLGHFVIDYCTGLGIKYKEIKHIDRKYPLPESRGWNFNIEGSSWNINLPGSIKIGYRF